MARSILGAKKAREMLRHGEAHGRALTERQKRFFGWVAGGRSTPRRRRTVLGKD